MDISHAARCRAGDNGTRIRASGRFRCSRESPQPLQRIASHAARRWRTHVRQHAVSPRGRARRRSRSRSRGRTRFRDRGNRPCAASSTGPAMPSMGPASSSERATADSSRSTPNRVRRPKDFASGGILDLKTPDVAPATTSEPRHAVRIDFPAVGLRKPRDHWLGDAGVPRARRGWRRARLGCAHRRAHVDVPHRAAARRARARHVGRRRELARAIGRQRLGAHDGRRGARHPLCADCRAGMGSLRWRSPRRQPLQQQHRRARRAEWRTPLALPSRAPRHLGLGH